MGRSRSHSLHQPSTGGNNLNPLKLFAKNQAQQVVNKQQQQQAQQLKRSQQLQSQLESIDECHSQAKDQNNIEKSNDLDSYANGNNTPSQDATTTARRETTKVLLNSIGNDNSSTTNNNNNYGELERNNCDKQLVGSNQNLKLSSKLYSPSMACCCVDAPIKDESCCYPDTTRCCPVEVKTTAQQLSNFSSTTALAKQSTNKEQIYPAYMQRQQQQLSRDPAINGLTPQSEVGKLFHKPKSFLAGDLNSGLNLSSKFDASQMDYLSNISNNNNNSNHCISRNSNRCADDSDDFVCCALSLTSSSLSSSSPSEAFVAMTSPPQPRIKSNQKRHKNSDTTKNNTTNKLLQRQQQQQQLHCRQFPDNSDITKQIGWISGSVQAFDKFDYSNNQQQFTSSQQRNLVNSQQPPIIQSSCSCSCYLKHDDQHLSKCCLFKSPPPTNTQPIVVGCEPVKSAQISGESCFNSGGRGGVVVGGESVTSSDKNRNFSALLDKKQHQISYANYLHKSNYLNSRITNNNQRSHLNRNLNNINNQNFSQDSIPKQKSASIQNTDKYQILLSSSTSSSSSTSTIPIADKTTTTTLHTNNEQDSKLVNQVEQDFYQLEKSTSSELWNHLDWKGVARRYREMPRQHRGQFWWQMRQSCFCHAFFSTIYNLFPILSSFKNYSFPGDLLTDLMAGFTIAILHIPQGMAYGMLSGVEPIYGLYVSFIPVLIMALMSKSLHVSYGTFAVVSMILANSVESVKTALKQQHQQQLLSSVQTQTQTDQKNINSAIEAPPSSSSSSIPSLPTPASISNTFDGLVLTNNHQPSTNPTQRILNNLLVSSSTNNFNANNQQQPFIGLNNNNNLSTMTFASTTTTSGENGLLTFDIDGVGVGVGGEFLLPSSIEILTSICLLTGMIQIFMSLARLGVLSLMFSDQLVSGFTTASAINVVTSQIAAVFDLNLPIVPEGLFKMCRIWFAFGNKLIEGFNQYTAILSLISIVFLLGVKEIIEPILRKRHKSFTCLPSELVLMSVLIFSSWYWQFEANYGIKIVGTVPTGLPEPSLPRLELAPLIYQDAITVALISFAMNLSLAQVYAKKFKYTLNPNQELFALGTSNFVGSFFSCFPCASSLSRSAIQSNLNVKSQICSLFSCAIVISIICYFAPILHDLPRSTLSCIIIVALKGILIQIRDLYLNWRLSKLDALVWMVTFLSVIALGITYGLALGIVASLFMVFFR